jgi:hypothetical protein
MRKDAGFDLIRGGSRTKLHCCGVGSEGKRIIDERCAVDAAEPQRFFSLDAMTLGAAFHRLVNLNSKS